LINIQCEGTRVRGLLLSIVHALFLLSSSNYSAAYKAAVDFPFFDSLIRNEVNIETVDEEIKHPFTAHPDRMRELKLGICRFARAQLRTRSAVPLCA
jgi:hypothetical protein